MTRTVLINDYFASRGSGGHYRIQSIAKALLKLGEEVALLSPHGTYTSLDRLPGEKPHYSVAAHYFHNTVLLLRRLRKMEANRYVFEVPFPAAKALVAAFKNLDGSVVHLDIGDYWAESRFDPIQRILDWLVTEVARMHPGISVATHSLRNLLVGRGIRGTSIHYLPSSVDFETFDLGKIEEASNRRNREFALVYSGSISKEQGCELLVPLLSAIVSEIPDATLLLLGDGAYAGELISQAERENVRQNIHLEGSVSHSQVPALLARCNVGLCLEPVGTHHDRGTFPQKVAEYMAMGCVPVLTPISEAPYLLDHGVDGLIVPKEQMAPIILRLLHDCRRLTTMQRRALETARLRFDLDRNVGELLAFWRQAEGTAA